MSEDLLDSFLSTALEELHSEKKILKETDLFSRESNIDAKPQENDTGKRPSTIHTGDTDSSDDEENKYYQDQRYNDCGKKVKHLLSDSAKPSTSRALLPDTSWKKTAKTAENVLIDPIFGIRIVNPLISSTALKERMTGREAVPFSRIKTFVNGNIKDKNWVISGVIVNKSTVKTSQKGNQFVILTLSDLKDDIKTVSMFLFGSAYKDFWKSATGIVIGVLNPSVFDKRDGSKDEACLSVDNAQKIMIFGESKDFGTCKSTKKNGDQCTAIVNKSRCEYCIYHIKQEYQKMSCQRSDLQSNFAGRGLTALRNKVLGKNEVFYAGKSYMAIPAKKSKKLEKKDEGRLLSLNGLSTNLVACKKVTERKKQANHLEISQSQRLRDIELLKKLGGLSDEQTEFNGTHSTQVTVQESRNLAKNIITKLKEKREANSKECIVEKKNEIFPKLTGFENGSIDLSIDLPKRRVNRAKINALNYIKKNGPLEKIDPNSVKAKKKRPITEIEGNETKKPKLENEFISDRFKKMMEITSKNIDLLEQKDNEEQEKYFYKLEKKEEMEEKMINTYKVPCKAVRCLKCKYTNFSASDLCKTERHPLKVFDAIKRFFKCTNCENRTVCLEIVPMKPCKNCGNGNWERTGMMKERKTVVGHTLSIRGGEQKFINSVAQNDSIALLVPDE